MPTPRLLPRLALGLSFLLAFPALAVPGFSVSKVAVQGDAAPGTADTFGSFLDVTLDAAGRVAFGVPMGSGFPNAGVWLDSGSGPTLQMRNGDPAPAPVSGTYLAFGSFVRMDGASGVATAVMVDIGGSGLGGLFRDDAGTDSSLIVEGDAAPTPPSGTLDAAIADIGIFGINAAGDVAFVSDVTGGTASTGLFLRSAAGAVSLLAQDGDLVNGGPDAFVDFDFPSLNDAGHLAFAGALAGGTAGAGLFLDTGSGPTTLALDGDAAPDTGGGSLVDFLYPALNLGGDVAFLSNVSGGSATGGLFLATPAGLDSVVVENQVLPGLGPVTTIGSLPDLATDGSTAMSLGFASGPVAAGVYVHDTGVFEPVAVDGDVAPDTGGASFASFGFVSRNDAGQVAFVATLDDGRTGVFLATPVTTPHVPVLPLAALPLLGVVLAASARRPLRDRH